MRPFFILLLLLKGAVNPLLWAQNTTPIIYLQKKGIYQQTFDGLANSGSFSLSGKGPHSFSAAPFSLGGLNGWQMMMVAGSGSNANFAPSTGSGTTSGVYSLGTSGSTERALGSLASSTGIYAFGLIITNNTGGTLNSFSGSFVAEQWRKGGSGNKNKWLGKYATGSFSSIQQTNLVTDSLLSLSSIVTTTGVATLNGNLPANQQLINFSINQINWKNGEQLIIRWEDADEAGNDDAMAIDDFIFSADSIAVNSTIPDSVVVNDIYSLANNPTNADTIQYAIQLGGDITGLTKSNFSLQTSGLSNASITKIEGSGNKYLATIYTGSGSGLLQLGIANNNNLLPGLTPLPFFAVDSQWIDKIKPQQISFYSNSDTLLKAGDTLKLLLQFNEPVILDSLSPTNYIPVTIGTRVKNITYTKGNNTNKLEFNYIIQPGERDKDGIRISSAFSVNNLLIKDRVDNNAVLIIQSSTIQSIKIDAIAPIFSLPKDTILQFCSNNTTVKLDSLLRVTNHESGEIISWKLAQAPQHLTINNSFIENSNSSSTIFPFTFIAENSLQFIGLDSCIFSVSDGINITYKKIIFNIHSLADSNIIASSQEICISTSPALLNGNAVNSSGIFYRWESSVNSDSSGFAGATGNNQLINYQPASLNNNTWFRRKIISTACTIISNPILITVKNNNLWIGKTNNNWHTTSNWCGNKIPLDSNEVTIPVTQNHPLITENAAAKKIIIEKGAYLTITGSLSISSAIVSDTAAVYAQKATIILNGVIQQVLTADIFKDATIQQLHMQNSEGVSISKPLFISSKISLSKGNLQTNDFLYLPYKAVIAQCAAGTNILGKVFVEHRLPERASGNYLVGNPFNNSLVLNRWINQPSSYYLATDSPADSFNIENKWTSINWANGFDWWKKGTVIKWHINGINTSTTDSSKYLNGSINTGLQEIKLPPTANGFHLIANPFISPVNTLAFTKSNRVGNYYWVFNPKQGTHGGYTPISANQPFILNPFDALIAFADTGANNSLLISEESKTNEWNDGAIPGCLEPDYFIAELSIYRDGIFWDKWIMTDKAGARNNRDSLDGVKLMNPDLNFYSVASDQQKLSVDARKLDANTVIPLRIENATNGTYFFKVDKTFLPPDLSLVLHDRFTNEYLSLKTDSILSFIITTDSLSRSPKRFEISKFIPKGNIQQLINLLTVKLFPNPAQHTISVGIKAAAAANTTIQIYSIAGELMKTVVENNLHWGIVRIPVGDLPNGQYILKVLNGSNVQLISFFKQ